MYPRRRKVYRRKRRAFRRRRYRKRIPRSLGPTRIYNWKQTVDLADIQTSAGVSPALFTNQFTLSSLPSFTEFQALFDQFRIKRIKIMYLPPNSIAWTGSTSSQPIGEFYTVLDFDDATTPGSLNDLLQYQTLKRTYFNKPHYRYFKPLATQSGVYLTGAVTTGYRSLPSNTWFDIATPNVVYYGIKGAFSVSPASTMVAQQIRVTATIYFQTRMTR